MKKPTPGMRVRDLWNPTRLGTVEIVGRQGEAWDTTLRRSGGAIIVKWDDATYARAEVWRVDCGPLSED